MLLHAQFGCVTVGFLLPIQTHTTNTYKHSLHKVSQADACEGTALWNEASKPEAKLKVNVREAHLEVLFCQKGKAVTLKQTSNEVRPSLCDEVLASFSGFSPAFCRILYKSWGGAWEQG